jgi:coatomer subunit beta'
VVIKIGSDEPIVSMNNGKVIFAKNLDLLTCNMKAIQEGYSEGEQIKPNIKELGHSDFYSMGLKHSPNGLQFCIYNDIEYSIFRS